MGLGAFVSQQAFLPPQPLCLCEEIKDMVFFYNSYGHRMPALYVKNKGRRKNFTLLFSHGNAEDITHSDHWIREISEKLECNIMAYEYSGYADTMTYNEGLTGPSELFCYSNGLAAYNYLIKQNVIPNNIVIFGRSLGSGPAVDLATKVDSAGLILQSPLLSAVRVVANTYFTMPFDMFANVDKINNIRSPLLIVHGENDGVVPVTHGKKLYEMATVQKYCLWLPTAGHNDIETNFTDPFLNKISEFLDCLKENRKY